MSLAWRDSPARLLFSWARWLSLKHPTIAFVNTRIPAVGLLGGLSFVTLLPGINFTKELGVIQQLNGLLQILAPFFVAALALVAAFPGEALDRRMGGLQPFTIVEGEHYNPTRREILGYLFAYLAGLSVIVYLAGAVIVAICNPSRPMLVVLLTVTLRGWIPFLMKGLYTGVMLHLFATTLLGLHFLGNFLSASQTARAPSPVSPPPLGEPPAPLQGSPVGSRLAFRPSKGQARSRSRSRL